MSTPTSRHEAIIAELNRAYEVVLRNMEALLHGDEFRGSLVAAYATGALDCAGHCIDTAIDMLSGPQEEVEAPDVRPGLPAAPRHFRKGRGTKGARTRRRPARSGG